MINPLNQLGLSLLEKFGLYDGSTDGMQKKCGDKVNLNSGSFEKFFFKMHGKTEPYEFRCPDFLFLKLKLQLKVHNLN